MELPTIKITYGTPAGTEKNKYKHINRMGL